MAINYIYIATSNFATNHDDRINVTGKRAAARISRRTREK
jgi:hypothetical protein